MFHWSLRHTCPLFLFSKTYFEVEICLWNQVSHWTSHLPALATYTCDAGTCLVLWSFVLAFDSVRSVNRSNKEHKPVSWYRMSTVLLSTLTLWFCIIRDPHGWPSPFTNMPLLTSDSFLTSIPPNLSWVTGHTEGIEEPLINLHRHVEKTKITALRCHTVLIDLTVR